MSYLRPLTLGSLILPSNIFYSPLAGCSDYPYRKMAALYRPGLFFCEMVKIEALIRYDTNTLRMLDYDKDMHPIGAQICGSNPTRAKQAAKIIEDLGFDLIDLNCGCPVDKVTKDGSGSGMLKNPELIGEMLTAILSTVQIPVTVKIRIGWDESSINAVAITKIAEQAGAKLISIHGRTRKQGYAGPANWTPITNCKKAATSIHIIGNGDVFSGEMAKKLFEQTKCDGLLVSRGTLGKPWIIEEIISTLEGKPFTISQEQIKSVLLRHISYILQYQEKKRTLLEIRKVACWYLRDHKGMKMLREWINKAKSVKEALETIQNYPW